MCQHTHPPLRSSLVEPGGAALQLNHSNSSYSSTWLGGAEPGLGRDGQPPDAHRPQGKGRIATAFHRPPTAFPLPVSTCRATTPDDPCMLIDLQAKKIDGGRVERILEQCGIALNKNTVPGDKSAMMPGAPAQCVCVLSAFHVVLELLALLLLPLHSLLMQQQAGLLVQAAGLQHFFSSRRCCLFSQFDHLSPAAAMHSCHAQLPCTACLSPCTACLSPCTAAMHSVLIADCVVQAAFGLAPRPSPPEASPRMCEHSLSLSLPFVAFPRSGSRGVSLRLVFH